MAQDGKMGKVPYLWQVRLLLSLCYRCSSRLLRRPIVYPVVIISLVVILITPFSLFGLSLIPILWGYSLPIPGFEIPLWQIFPLCDLHHSNRPGWAHNFGNYQVFKADPWANRNRYGYLWKLRISALSAILRA
jgi:hypothetical protein